MMVLGTSAPDFDLVIVGGSFAGLVAARTAAMRGLRVAVIDAKPEPGAALRTTGILVKEAAEVLDLPFSLTRKIHGVRLYSPSMRSVDLHSPGYFFLATETAALLRWLAREAALSGAELFYGCRFEGAQREDGAIYLPGLDKRTRYLIGADGAHSAVARCFGLGRNRRFLTGVELELPGDAGLDSGYLHCFLDRRLAPGYIAWGVPGVGITQIGLACRQGHRPDTAALLRKVAPLTLLCRQKLLGRRAGPIPAGGLVRPFASEGVLLIGDAAGLVSPMTAGGIHNAFHFARRAAQVVAEFLQDQGPEPSRVLAREFPKYRLKGLGRQLLNLGPPDALFDLLIAVPAFQAFARKVYFHHRLGLMAPTGSRYYRPAPKDLPAGPLR
jgi:flavin-dependent dehydrogenase